MNNKELITDIVRQFKDVGIRSAELDARILLEKCGGRVSEKFYELAERRKKREPISHIIGRREFWSLDFVVTKDTLDPRPDTETIIEAAIKTHEDRKKKLEILDLGTGTGCILLTLLKEFNMAKGIGVDISESAIMVAKQNCKNLALEDRAEFIKTNWGEKLDKKFDLIVSNPPYIPSNTIETLEPELNYEPRLALDGGEDGLMCYRKIISQVGDLLKPEGVVLLELGIGQKEAVASIAEKQGLFVKEIYKDLAGIDRCIKLTNH